MSNERALYKFNAEYRNEEPRHYAKIANCVGHLE
jgi:hypothetical protein